MMPIVSNTFTGTEPFVDATPIFPITGTAVGLHRYRPATDPCLRRL
jgi:hypothetical protein